MIDYSHVSKEYSGDREPVSALRDVSLSVEAGEFCVLLGPSGCGKTTLLRITNRLVDLTSGSVTIQGKNILDQDPVALRRSIGYVIQGVGLFPHRTVAQNVATTLRLVGADKNYTSKRVNELLEMVRLDPAVYRDRYPSDLSGGEAQRVGVARALGNDPDLLLMDEPFGAIDPINRSEIQQEFHALQRELGKTVVLVTHDVPEAFLFGDRIALMQSGQLVQHGSPAELLKNPATPFVREFFGAEAEIHLLDSLTIEDVGGLPPPAEVHGLPEISQGASLKSALGTMLACGTDRLLVTGDGQPGKLLTFEAILSGMQSQTGGE